VIRGRSARFPSGKAALFLFAALLLVAAAPSRGTATEEFAAQTGKACGFCHLDPSGGGELTAEGKAFLRSRAAAGQAVPEVGGLRRVVRFTAGFLHLFTAVLWFGTILYVHLLLKPSYAAHGLPRGELTVGWVSIVVIAVTGVILTVFHLRSPADLLHTRFGVLLTIKVALFLVMVSTAAIVTFVIGPRLKRRRAAAGPGKGEMTPDDLSRYDGKEGRPAYFAFRGRVFDASASRLWKGGFHLGRHPAGFDLTEALKQAPHGEEKIAALPEVGALAAGVPAPEKPPHLKVFYFLTYFNLGLVLAILFVISLWRWW
jgi:predicted heme/steroid binding protein/uncharacterized membrane protein